MDREVFETVAISVYLEKDDLKLKVSQELEDDDLRKEQEH